MAFQDAIGTTTSGAETDESAPDDRDAPTEAPDLDPFSMTWQTDSYDVDDRTVDRALSVLVAVTNLI